MSDSGGGAAEEPRWLAGNVAGEEEARLWAGKIAVACGWPQEVRRFQVPMQLPETS